MKKILTLAMLAMLTLAMTACSSPAKNEDPKEDIVLQDFEKQIQKAGTFVVGTSPDYPPFESLSTTGELIGFDIDLMEALGNTIKTSDGQTYTIEWVQMSFDTIVSAVQTGQVDLGISGFTYDKDREVLFSTAYLESQQVVLVNPSSTITSITDLEGKNIGVQLGTTGEGAASEIAGATLMSLNNVPVLVETLKNNAVDAIVVDKAVADNYVKNVGLVLLSEPLIDENVSIIAKTGNDDLMAELNKAIEAYLSTPDYQTLLETWEMASE